MKLITVATALFSAWVGFATLANAQSREQNGISIDLSGPTEARAAGAEALIRKAQQSGRVRVIVGLNAPAPAEALTEAQERAEVERMESTQRALSRRHGVTEADTVTFEYIPFVSMWVTPGQLRSLLNDPAILNVQEDVPGEAGLAQSVPKIRANTLWNQGFMGNGWTVAVLDTGVDKSHPMFAGKVVSEACFSTNGNGATSMCPGRVRQSVAPGSGVDCKPRGFSVCYHGTHVAGIAAGNMSSLKGVARGSKIIAVQVFSKQGNSVVTFSTDWVKGLNRVYALRTKYKIAAVNMSLGFGQFTGPCDTQVPSATAIIKKLRTAKIATIVSSMNDSLNGQMRSPACISAAIAVGSTTKQDQISSFSNHALQVRHMAPGSDIRSALAGGGFKVDSGTSMAAPHAAGAYALLRDVRTNVTVDDISAALECTGVNVTRSGVTEKRIDLVQAKAYLLNPPRAVKSFNFLNPNQGQQWLAHAGGWDINGGFLRINEGNAGWKVATTAHCNEGFNINSNMARSYDNPARSGVNGVIFKAQFAGNFVGGYLAFYNRANNGVGGVAGLLRFDGFNLGTNTGLFKQLCSKALPHNNNGINKVTVVTRGGLHRVSLNDTPVCAATDHTYGTGRAGIATFIDVPTVGGFGAADFVITPVEAVPPAGDRREGAEGAEDAPEQAAGEVAAVRAD